MITISYINFWSKEYNNIYFTKFINKNIDTVNIVNNNDNPDILICSWMCNINNVITINAKIKLFFYGENLNRYPPYNNIELLKSTFDLIIGFKYDDKDNKILRFPLWLLYYPYYNMNDKDNNIINYLETSHKLNNSIDKPYLGALIARHDNGGQRRILLSELSKYGKVLCPSIYNNNCKKINKGNNAKLDFLKYTKYNICPENSLFEGYFTEKIFQALEAGTIPIYWAINEPETDILNRNKYCFIKNINDKDEVNTKIKDVIENPESYIDGNIFNDDAYTIISKYYDNLIKEIKRLLV